MILIKIDVLWFRTHQYFYFAGKNCYQNNLSKFMSIFNPSPPHTQKNIKNFILVQETFNLSIYNVSKNCHFHADVLFKNCTFSAIHNVIFTNENFSTCWDLSPFYKLLRKRKCHSFKQMCHFVHWESHFCLKHPFYWDAAVLYIQILIVLCNVSQIPNIRN